MRAEPWSHQAHVSPANVIVFFIILRGAPPKGMRARTHYRALMMNAWRFSLPSVPPA
eukprot:SAG25_NODE_66_length_17563_cov_34.737918_13_plen_57_part_00